MKPLTDPIRLIGIRVSMLRDRDVCKKERIFGPERTAILQKYGAGRKNYFINEDPDDCEDIKSSSLKEFKQKDPKDIVNENGNPMDDPEVRKSFDQEIEINLDKNDDNFTPEERAQIEKMSKEQNRPEF